MSNTACTFIHPAQALPQWMASRRINGTRGSQLGPVDMPIVRPEQLTIQSAIRASFNKGTALNRDAVLDPSVDNLTRNAKQSPDGGLPAKIKQCVLERGAMENHVDIVATSLTSGKQSVAAPMQKLGMEVWKHIAEELHRRKKTNVWFGLQLGETRQVIAGWKKRGVPAKDHERIAELFGWTIDRLVKGADDAEHTQAAPVADAAPAIAAAIYSPMALDLARQLDEIVDLDEKQKAYALMVHIARQSAVPSPVVPSAKVPAQSPSGLVVSPTPNPHRAK